MFFAQMLGRLQSIFAIGDKGGIYQLYTTPDSTAFPPGFIWWSIKNASELSFAMRYTRLYGTQKGIVDTCGPISN
jgi:hypothetical protein